jgi:peptidyl-prolyl cis-trans isomerase D
MYPIVSIIEKTLLPSEETETKATDDAYNMLYALDEKVSRKSTPKAKLDIFDTIAKQKGYFVRPIRILDENPAAQGIATSFAQDRILKLAYDENSEVGTLCSAPIKDQNRYIVAIVASIREKGTPEFIDVQDAMRVEVLKEKKAERFIKQMTGAGSLDALAAKGKTIVNKAEVVFANPQLQGGGYEPTVVGSLFSGLKDGQKTLPLKGEQGVYVIRIDKTVKAPATSNYSMETAQLLNSAKSAVQNEAKMALLKLSEVKDNRKFLSLGIRR